LQLFFHSFHVSPFVFCVIHPCKTERREEKRGEEKEEEEKKKKKTTKETECTSPLPPGCPVTPKTNFMMLS